MIKILKTEIKKAIFSNTYLLGLSLMLFFAMLSALYTIEFFGKYNPNFIYENTVNGMVKRNPDFPMMSVFNAWVGGDTLSLAQKLFFIFMPVGAAIPFAWSYHNENKNGYIKNIAIRINIKYYYFAKSISIFFSGALVILIPYIVNILFVSAFVPYYPTWCGYTFYNLVFYDSLWADVFYTRPYLHMLLYVTLNTLYGGIFALLSFTLSFYIKKYVMIIFGPFLFFMIFGFLEKLIYNNFFSNSLVYYEFIPTIFLHSRSINYQVSGWAVILVTTILMGYIVISVLFKVRKHEFL